MIKLFQYIVSIVWTPYRKYAKRVHTFYIIYKDILDTRQEYILYSWVYYSMSTTKMDRIYNRNLKFKINIKINIEIKIKKLKQELTERERRLAISHRP